MPEESIGAPLIVVRDVVKSYNPDQDRAVALRGVSLTIAQGDFVAIIGPSGSGKSTLLNLVAGLDKPTSGSVQVQGREITTMGEDQLARWRGGAVGIVFQFFQLLPTLTALENVMLAMELGGVKEDCRKRAEERLVAVGLAGLGHHLPSELSGGEQQRVAIARALANDPPLLLADEPTGNLDSATGQRIFDLLGEVNARGTTVVLVTHEHCLAARARRVIEMRDGTIASVGC